MKKRNKNSALKWYDNAHFITNLIIVIISIFIIASQSLANGELSFALFSSVINHNSIYILALLYFILLKFSFGQKIFNYMKLEDAYCIVFCFFVFFFKWKVLLVSN